MTSAVTESAAGPLDSEPRGAGRRLRVAQGVSVAAAFSLLLAGTNAITPVLPLYREFHGFTPLTMSLTFICYVAVLTLVLLLMSRPALVRWSPWCLCGALALAVCADVLVSSASEPGVLAGRAVAGAAGGLGTGAAAALVVAALGSRGSSLSATGNLIGAVIGTAFGQICVAALGADAVHWTFILHGAACLAVAAALATILVRRRRQNRTALSAVVTGGRSSLSALRHHMMPTAVGCLAWISLSCVVVFLPSFFGELGMDTVKAVGVIALLVFSAAGQILSPYLARRVPWVSGVAALAVGVGAVLAGAAAHLSYISLAGFAVLGAGLGIAYRLGLVMLTRGAAPANHGALSSAYAAVTYAVAALVVLAAGAAGNALGVQTVVYLVFGIVGVSALAAALRTPRLGDTAT